MNYNSILKKDDIIGINIFKNKINIVASGMVESKRYLWRDFRIRTSDF